MPGSIYRILAKETRYMYMGLEIDFVDFNIRTLIPRGLALGMKLKARKNLDLNQICESCHIQYPNEYFLEVVL